MTTEKLTMKTTNMADENFRKLQELFPEAVTEIEENGKIVRAIDKDKLQQLISTSVVEGSKERYQFTWPGKKNSVALANSSSNMTLRPQVKMSKDFENTQNLYIEGDNFEVLKCLREKYLHKIKLIYIDPPYNTGKNYIYHNDFSLNANEFLMQSGIKTEEGTFVSNPKTYGRFHSDWLSMIYQRLLIARNLLTEDGVLICAIDENEQASVYQILKEIFSEANFDLVTVTVVHNPRGIQGKNFSYTHEYAIFVYSKEIKAISNRKIEDEEVDWSQLRNWGSESERSDAKNCFYPIIVKNDEIIGFGSVCSDSFHPKQTEKIGEEFYVYPIDKSGIERKWRYARQTVEGIRNMLKTRKTNNGYEILIGKNFGSQRTVWNNKRYDANEYGTKIVNELVDGGGFSFPKSLYTVYDAVIAATGENKDCIVLDFFSGSATTAHAVMKLNSEDGGNRKFIMVQLPEMIPEEEIAYKAGYNTICDIGKERIRRAGAKIKEELEKTNPERAKTLDTGFRVLRLDSSNMKDVFYRPVDLKRDNLLDYTSNVKEDRTEMDLLFQIMPELNADYTSKIEETYEDGKTIFNVESNYIVACFAEDISEKVIRKVASYKPDYAVFRDSCFPKDSDLANVEQIFRAESPETRLRIL